MERDSPFVMLGRNGAVSIVTLNRPDRLNAIGLELVTRLHTAMAAAQADPETRVIVFTGAGRAFCAGDDLKEFGQQSASLESMADLGERVQQVTRDIMMGPKIVIGAMHGYAVGGGFEWMLNCDMVVAAENLMAFTPEMALGHFVTGGATHLLPQALGYQRAMELMVLGEQQNAQSLLRMGLVNRVVSTDMMLPTAMELAREVATRAPHALAYLKHVMNRARGGLAEALEREREAAVACGSHPETAARIEAFSRKG